LVLIAVLALGGCAVAPAVEDGLTAPVHFKMIAGAPLVRDGRPAFRAAFCSMLHAERVAAPDDGACARWLWRLTDEPVADAGRAVPAVNPERLDVVLVTGAFSECVGVSSRPFSAGAERLRAAGASVRTIVVGGRSGTAYNARQIAETLAELPIAGERKVILVGYSKGGLDILRFLNDFPELAARVDAVVGVATPLFGTPLADLTASTYAALVAKVPHWKCPPGDGEVIASLTPDAATRWLEANPLPAGVNYYSLVAFTTREHVGRALAPFWKHLGGTTVRNDGQVVATDAVIPGSTLLGYANADHWGIAQTIETDHPVLAGRPDPELFPLEQLFVTMVTFVANDLEQGVGRVAGTPVAGPEENVR
jgi:pimeloyl-ACP methyl ester carboxylesterase